NALVAPVLPYVPEGRVDPPTGHMRFPGTITVPEDAFDKVIEYAARSLKQHGFRDIVFLGDHGSYQQEEAAVAQRLDREWMATLAIGLCLWTGRLLATAALDLLPGMPPVVDPANLYSEVSAGHLSPAVAGDLPRVYVPTLKSNEVYVIDPAALRVVDRFPVGPEPQHIVPSWDLRTLWVNNNGRRGLEGSLTPIDPRTGKPGPAIAVEDPYNLYFTADGR